MNDTVCMRLKTCARTKKGSGLTSHQLILLSPQILASHRYVWMTYIFTLGPKMTFVVNDILRDMVETQDGEKR